VSYIHYECGGEVTFLARRCKKCGKQWPLSALWSTDIPEDMYYDFKEPPRWVKVITRLSIVIIVAALLLGIMVLFFGIGWQGILGLLFLTCVVILIAYFSKRKNKRG